MKHHALFHTIAILGLAATGLHGQEAGADPYRKQNHPEPIALEQANKAEPSGSDDEFVRHLSLCYEEFSLPIQTAAMLQRQQKSDLELYNHLVANLDKQDIHQESFAMLMVRSGYQAISESIDEIIYPTSFNTAQGLQRIEDGADVGDGETAAVDPAAGHVITCGCRKASDGARNADLVRLAVINTPGDFETRNVGTTLSMEASLDDETGRVDVRLRPEHVHLAGNKTYGQGASMVEVPEFQAQRIDTNITLGLDTPCLLGTITPSPGQLERTDSVGRVWFAFLTVRQAK